MKSVFSCLHITENATYPYYNYSVTQRVTYRWIIQVIAAITDLNIKQDIHIIVIILQVG